MSNHGENYRFGRPRKFKTQESLANAVADYFNNNPRSEWRITGLAVELDVDRKSLYNWINEKRDFFHIIKRACRMIEDKYASNCEKRGNAGDIFILKNMGWKDKQEVDLNHSGAVDLGGVFKDMNK